MVSVKYVLRALFCRWSVSLIHCPDVYVRLRTIHKLYALAPSFGALDGWLRGLPADSSARVWDADIGPAGGEETNEGTRWRWSVESYAFSSVEIRFVDRLSDSDLLRDADAYTRLSLSVSSSKR
jgi:hypothetical protein